MSSLQGQEWQALLKAGANAQMRTSLPPPSTLSSMPLIERVCAAKACPGRDTNSLLTLCEC